MDGCGDPRTELIVCGHEGLVRSTPTSLARAASLQHCQHNKTHHHHVRIHMHMCSPRRFKYIVSSRRLYIDSHLRERCELYIEHSASTPRTDFVLRSPLLTFTAICDARRVRAVVNFAPTCKDLELKRRMHTCTQDGQIKVAP
jgi:hypothetical protein